MLATLLYLAYALSGLRAARLQTAGMVVTTVSLVAGVLAGVLMLALVESVLLAVVAAALAAVVLFAAWVRYVRGSILRTIASLAVRFPSPEPRDGAPTIEG